MGDQTVDYLKRLWTSGMPTTISGDHVYVESGARVVTTFASGQGFSGMPVTISGDPVIISGQPVTISGQPVTISGDHVYVESGARVVTTFASGQGFSGIPLTVGSGLHVWISGQHVFMESGAHVVGDFTTEVESGLHVWISGQHVFMESGAHVVGDFTTEVESGLHVLVSGQPVTISGDHIFQESGAFVTTQPEIAVEVLSGQIHILSGIIAVESGLHVLISGQHVFMESGAHVVATVSVSSGLHVLISGQPVTISGDHIFQESGAFVTTQPNIQVSGTIRALISGDHVHLESGDNVDVYEYGQFYLSGDWRPKIVSASGHLLTGIHAWDGTSWVRLISQNNRLLTTMDSGFGVTVQSGLHVLVSGQPMTISGDHIFQESGAFVTTQPEIAVEVLSGQIHILSGIIAVESGLHVWISGQHVFLESGAHVVAEATVSVDSGLHVLISGQPVTISGDHIFQESGAFVTTQPSIQVNSGIMDVEVLSGQIHVLSGIITVESGLHVLISGQHLFQESGAFVTTQPGIQVSGAVIISGDTNIYGYDGTSGFSSGVWRPIAICGSGELIICSGAQVITQPSIQVNSGIMDVEVLSGQIHILSGIIAVESGLHVLISGQHVFMESGAHVVATVSVSSGLHVLISGQPVTISGDHIFQESGAFVTTQPGIQVSGAVIISGDTNIYGYDGTSGFSSGVWRPIAICGSGEIIICSGAQVITQPSIQVNSGIMDVEVLSGQIHILSGIITVESGLHVIVSGQPVTISGDHVYIESGARVVTTFASGQGFSGIPLTVGSGLHILISGQPVTISGDHIFQESGAFVTTQPSIQVNSGILDVEVLSGQIHILSGLITVESGLHVWISGQHVFQESGAFVTTQPGIQVSGAVIVSGTLSADISGQPIHVGCATQVRTGRYVPVIEGSGGASLCISGQWCSGLIHSIIIKNLEGNDVVTVGGVDCKPFSGFGFPLSEKEGVNLDMCEVCDVWVRGATSGQHVAWIATDY